MFLIVFGEKGIDIGVLFVILELVRDWVEYDFKGFN